MSLTIAWTKDFSSKKFLIKRNRKFILLCEHRSVTLFVDLGGFVMDLWEWTFWDAGICNGKEGGKW